MEDTTDRSKQVKRLGDKLDQVKESMEQRKQQVIQLLLEFNGVEITAKESQYCLWKGC